MLVWLLYYSVRRYAYPAVLHIPATTSDHVEGKSLCLVVRVDNILSTEEMEELETVSKAFSNGSLMVWLWPFTALLTPPTLVTVQIHQHLMTRDGVVEPLTFTALFGSTVSECWVFELSPGTLPWKMKRSCRIIRCSGGPSWSQPSYSWR